MDTRCLYDVEQEVKYLREDLASMSIADYDLVEIVSHFVDFWRDGERAIASYKTHGCMVEWLDATSEDGMVLYESSLRFYGKLCHLMHDLQGYEIARAELSEDECSLLVYVR